MNTKKIFENLNCGIIITSAEGSIKYMNPNAERLTGHTFADSESRDVFYVFGRANIENTKKIKTYFNGIYENDPEFLGKDLNVHLKGRTFEFFALCLKADKIDDEYVIEIEDKTDFKSLEHKLNMLFDYYQSVLFTVDKSGQFIDMNKKTKEKIRINGLEKDVKWFSLIAEKDLSDAKKFFAKTTKSRHPQTTILKCLDVDSQKYCDITILPISTDKFYVLFTDQSAKVSYKEKLNMMSIKDSLTDAFNRNYLDILSESLMETADRYSEPITALAMEIVQFKKITNRYGYDISDMILKSVAKRIIDISRKSDALFRLSSERFILLLPKTSGKNAMVVAEKIKTAISTMSFTAVKKINIAIGICERKNYESQRRWIQKTEISLDKALKTKNYIATYKSGDIDKKNNKIDIVLKALSNNSQIDKEHQQLLNMIGRMESPKEGDEKVTAQDFVDHIREHFDNELEILKEHHYQDWEHHRDLHSQVVDRAGVIIEKINAGVVDEKTAIYFIFDELLYKHLSNDDVEYFDLFK